MENQKQRQLRQVSISKDGEVSVKFVEIITIKPEQEDGEDVIITNKYSVKSPQRPHKDLLDTIKKLRKFALEICEIETDSKSIINWTVSQVKIAGDVSMHQSRVILTLAKSVERTGKVIEFNSPQTTMYGESEYDNADQMAVVIEDLIEEVWSYLNGTKTESSSQLALFDYPKMKVA